MSSHAIPSSKLLNITEVGVMRLRMRYIASSLRSKITLPTLHKMYQEGKPIAMLTAYDYPTGRLCETANVDITLVGDSLAQVCLGYDSTNRLTLDEMIHHCKAVARGSKSPFFMADMPFGTAFTPEDAVKNAARLIREGGIEAVKLEGGLEVIETVKKLTTYGIPVMGHIGLMPQRASSLGGFTVQGRSEKSASSILDIALHLQDAGVFAILLEAVPGVVGGYIARNTPKVPIIGIGAGNAVDGQVLVVTDVLGITPKPPKFVRRFADFGGAGQTAIESYVAAVKGREFPGKEESYLMPRDQAQLLRSQLGRSEVQPSIETSENAFSSKTSATNEHAMEPSVVERSTEKPTTDHTTTQAVSQGHTDNVRQNHTI